MEFLEKDLEDIIFHATHEQLRNRNLYIRGKKYRQLKIGNYGIADLVFIQRPFFHPYEKHLTKGVITIFELKKDKIGLHTFDQLIRYANGVKFYLQKRGLIGHYDISLIAIGKTVDLSSSFCYLPNLLNQDISENKIGYTEPIIKFEAFTYLYDFDGIKFNEIYDYQLKNNGF